MSSCMKKEQVVSFKTAQLDFKTCHLFSPPVIPESPPKMETKESSQSPNSQTKSPLTSHVSGQTLFLLTDQTWR